MHASFIQIQQRCLFISKAYCRLYHSVCNPSDQVYIGYDLNTGDAFFMATIKQALDRPQQARPR